MGGRKPHKDSYTYVYVVVVVHPPGVVINTVCGPTEPGGVRQLMTAAPAKMTVAADPPIVTVVPGANPEPTITNVLPPAAGPCGLIGFVTDGVGLNAPLENWVSGFVTTTVESHGTAAGIGNVIDVGLMLSGVTGEPATVKLATGEKFHPATVIV